MSRPPKKASDELVWASEVMEVYRNLGSLPNSRHWSSISAKHLFEWANRDENETKFLADLVPKATALKAKHGLEEVAEAALKIDIKSIKDLQERLGRAILESQNDEPAEPVVDEAALEEPAEPVVDEAALAEMLF